MDSSNTTTDNLQETNPVSDNAKGKPSHYYSIRMHKAVLWASLILIALGLTVIFSLVIGLMEHAYSGWFGTVEEQTESGQSGLGFNLEVLPDFFGSMAGILVGFILEWLIFEKIKNLSKYRTIITCLKIEFDKIEMLLKLNRKKIREVIIDDIVLSAENSVIIENLPHFFVFRRSRRGEELLSLLQEIHGEITQRNKAIDDKKAEECDDKAKEPFKFNENGELTKETMRDSILDKIETFKRATMKAI